MVIKILKILFIILRIKLIIFFVIFCNWEDKCFVSLLVIIVKLIGSWYLDVYWLNDFNCLFFDLS